MSLLVFFVFKIQCFRICQNLLGLAIGGLEGCLIKEKQLELLPFYHKNRSSLSSGVMVAATAIGDLMQRRRQVHTTLTRMDLQLLGVRKREMSGAAEDE